MEQHAAGGRGLFRFLGCLLRVLIEATRELRVHALPVRHREGRVRAVGNTLILLTTRVDRILRTAVLAAVGRRAS